MFCVQSSQNGAGDGQPQGHAGRMVLVVPGLFQMRYESKAQVFSARPDLKSVLARRYA